MNNMLQTTLNNIPENPGCYFMKDKYDEIIYVGKAKNLSRRVKSYFQKASNGKTARLVSEIVSIDYVIVNSEREALILENNLIKEHMPKYNILLKDDKTYPYIAITNERHPRLVFTRDVKRKYKAIFGPFPNVIEARKTFELLNKLYGLRKCDILPKKVCLYYHLGQCHAPCIQTVEKEQYEIDVRNISDILKGNISKIKNTLQTQMLEASEQLQFERAKDIRDTIQSVEMTLGETQHIDLKLKGAVDVFGLYEKNGWLAMNLIHIRDGRIKANRQELYELNEANVEDEIENLIIHLYTSKNIEKPKEIITSYPFTETLHEIIGSKMITPKRGEKQQILAVAIDNAKMLYDKEIANKLSEEKTKQELKKVVEAVLNQKEIEIIEMVDISNFGDQSIVGGVVQFRNFEMNKRGYRYYKLDDQEAQDDYKAMQTVVHRRFSRLLKEKKRLPDVFVVDGGKGHVQAVSEIFDQLHVETLLIGLAKDHNHKTSHIVIKQDDTLQEIPLGMNDFGRFFMKIQDEVHRFTISFMHRSHSKKLQQTELDLIPGVGKTYRRRLLQEFHSIHEIQNASLDDLKNVVPENIAQNIKQYFTNTNIE
ncbi:MAG: excinuclease ABC subunit UvrC [Culicoidibacterales bacterium]